MSELSKHADALEQMLKDNLESDIVSLVAKRASLTPVEALRVFYSSRLAKQIDSGENGIQYLDARVLVDDLFENESELFESVRVDA